MLIAVLGAVAAAFLVGGAPKKYLHTYSLRSVGACVWPWLPERVVVVHIPCVLSYLLLIYTYTVCRSGSSLYIYRVYYYLLLTTYYLPVLIAPPHVGANTHT